ncbi:ABC transporter permease [Clostridiales bacterium PH28_bin88]|nr:ABC transporter permease [Clostridiales bacterium PH28_bin88]
MVVNKQQFNETSRRYQEYLLGIVLVVLGWQLLSILVAKPVIPGPMPAMVRFFEVLVPDLGRDWLISAYRVALSLVASLVIAVPSGLYLGRERRLDRVVAPAIYLLYPVPKVAFLPVLFILAGIGDATRIFLIFLIVFFHILVTTRDAARGVSSHSIYSVLSLGANRRQVYLHVIFPACLPKILTACRVSLGTAIAVLFLSETVAGSNGLGNFIFDASYRADYELMFAGIIGMSLLGLILYAVLDGLEKRWCSWQHL